MKNTQEGVEILTEPLTIVEVRSMEPMLKEQLIPLLINIVDAGASVGFLPPLSREEAGRYWDQALEPGVRMWIAMRERDIVGTVQLHLALKANGSHRAEIAKLMVSPGCRRNGIARFLMQTAEQAASFENRSLLVLDTRAGDPSNLLYQSMGYVEAGRIPRYARSADGSLDDTVFYYKEI